MSKVYYTFILDQQKIEEIEEEIVKNQIVSIEPDETRKSKTHFSIKCYKDNVEDIEKLISLLIRTHNLKDNGFVKPNFDESIIVWLNLRVSTKFGKVDFLLTSLWFDFLIENGISFSIAKVKTETFLVSETIPIWISLADIKKMENLLKKGYSKFGRPYWEEVTHHRLVV